MKKKKMPLMKGKKAMPKEMAAKGDKEKMGRKKRLEGKAV